MMEENGNENENFNFSEEKPKKKGMGPLKGLLLAILIVFLICVIGLLIRMVVSGDGDYFKPIKTIFGIEGEKEDKEASNQSSTDKTDVSKSLTNRYSLLSSSVDAKNVKHYRLTLDIQELLEKAMEDPKLNTVDDTDEDDYGYDDEDNYSYDDSDEDYYYDEESYSTQTSNDFASSMASYLSLLEQMIDLVDGEIYADVYFNGNELVQVIIGFDYDKLVGNIYDFIIDNADEETIEGMEDDGIESEEDFKDYIVDTLAEQLDKDALVEELMENEEAEEVLSDLGIKERDIENSIDIVNESGLVEIYINGTDKLNDLLSEYLSDPTFLEEIEDVADENDYTLDEDNLIEDLLLLANEQEEYQDYGIEFVKVK